MAECIVLTRRFIKRDRQDEFLAVNGGQASRSPKTGLIRETLTRLDDVSNLPVGMKSLNIAGNPDCVTFLSIAHWRTLADFESQFSSAGGTGQADYESAPCERVVLTVV